MSVLVSMIWVRRRYLIELDDVGVTEYLEDADLASYSFNIGLLYDLLFLQGLHRHSLLRPDVHPQPHLSECSLSDALS